MNEDIKQVEKLICSNINLEKTSYLKLDRQVWDIDRNILKKYYKVKQSDHGVEIIIDLSDTTKGKVLSIKICENYVTTKELLKLNKIKVSNENKSRK